MKILPHTAYPHKPWWHLCDDFIMQYFEQTVDMSLQQVCFSRGIFSKMTVYANYQALIDKLYMYSDIVYCF